MTIHLTTFGGLRVIGDDGEIDSLLGRRLRAALFVYLAIERRVPRASLTAVFWPERDEDQARHALRQGLYDLRKAMGGGWLDATTHEVRVTPDVRTDAQAFATALTQGQQESAARLYDGPFLDGVHLVDQKPWETWVDGRRAGYGRAFRRACREWLAARRAAGDLAGTLEAAQHWVATDPFDDEAQHRLIETLAEAGERIEAIRQYEAYARLLEPDGLRPLDETVALLDRVRSDAAAWPDRTRESPPLPAAPDPSTPGPERRASFSTPWWRTALAEARTLWHRRRRAVAVLVAAVMLPIAFWFVQPRWQGWSTPVLGWLAAESSSSEKADRIVMADFGGPTSDPDLGSVITDAIRIDLLKTSFLRVLEASEVNAILHEMQVEPGARLTVERAREVALRAGVKAVLDGEIARAGTGYVLTAELRSSASGHTLAAFRESARGPDDVIPAIDRLSRQIRRQAGESLESVRATPPLGRVTTSSLDALHLYTRAERAARRGDDHRVLSLLDETLEADPEFAMAWRLLAVTLYNTGLDRAREVKAATRAYELRQSLGPRERHLTEAEYHSRVTRDRDATIEAYRRVLEIEPDDPKALNNLALLYYFSNAYAAAAELLERLIDNPRAASVSFANLVRVRIAQGRLDEARRAAERFGVRYPRSMDAAVARFWVLLLSDETANASAQLEPLLDDPGRSPLERSRTHDHLARLALWRGWLADARAHLEAAERIARDAGAPYHPLIWRLRRAHVEVAVGDPERGAGLILESSERGSLDEVSPADRRHLLQAKILGMAGRTDAAESAVRRFEADVPPALRDGYRTQHESARAMLQLRRGEPMQAVRILERLRDSYPCRFCFADLMGWALRDAGRPAEAVHEWKNAMTWKDSFNHLGFRLARHLWMLQHAPALYEELGDTTRAVEHYRRLVELWDGADPELQPRVQHARQRIAELLGTRN